MRGIKPGLIAILALGLLAGSAVGVAAQEEATAVEFTGATSFGPCTPDYCDNPIVEPFTDPRLEGQFRVWPGAVEYPGGPTIWMLGFSMHDDEGGWVERPSITVTHPDGQNATRVVTMDGHGAYEGLTLVAEVSLTGETWDWHGYIVDGELPPAPTIELPAVGGFVGTLPPNGTYSAEITAEDLVAKGASAEFAQANQGTWTWTFADGTLALVQSPYSEGCSGTYESIDGTLVRMATTVETECSYRGDILWAPEFTREVSKNPYRPDGIRFQNLPTLDASDELADITAYFDRVFIRVE